MLWLRPSRTIARTHYKYPLVAKIISQYLVKPFTLLSRFAWRSWCSPIDHEKYEASGQRILVPGQDTPAFRVKPGKIGFFGRETQEKRL